MAREDNHIISLNPELDSYTRCREAAFSTMHLIDPSNYGYSVAAGEITGSEARARVLAYATCVPCIEDFIS